MRAAVAGGADAVYLALQKYGARAFAGNFTPETLPQAVRFCHLHGVKVYLTVNTLLKDSELDDAIATVLQAADSGVDAFIVQDLGLITALRTKFPQLTLHVSTQAGVCNEYGARFFESMGCARVVLARETLPEDIASIKKNTKIQVETFCQGALCVAYSGNCYYSSLVSGQSGNRGRCLQLCRKPYVSGKNRGYFLSAKDICLLDEIKELRALGVDSVKIEGRMRSPAYVYEASRVYRAAIDGTPLPNGREALKRVFNRGDYCKAYFVHPTEKVIEPKVQNHIGVPCGTVTAVCGNCATVAGSTLTVGDGVKCMKNGCETGGGTVTAPGIVSFTGNVHTGDEARLTLSAALEKKVQALDVRIRVRIEVSAHIGKPLVLKLLSCGKQVEVLSTVPVQTAEKRAVTVNDVCAAIGLLGGTDFVADNVEVLLDDNAFFPVSALKELRRTAVRRLEEQLLAPSSSAPSLPYTPPNIVQPQFLPNAVFVRVSSGETLKKLRVNYNEIILAPSDYSDLAALQTQCAVCPQSPWLELPFIARGKDTEVLRALRNLPVKGFVANNVAHLTLFEGKPILQGIGLNRANGGFFGAYIGSIETDTDGIVYAYGKPPYMHFAHCPKRTQGGSCKDCTGYAIELRDNKGCAMTIRRQKIFYCYGILRPNAPLERLRETKSRSRIIDLCDCTDEEIAALQLRMQNLRI